MFGLDKGLIDNIVNIVSKYSEVEKVCIFGSRARGDYKSTSDIDIAIFSQNISSTTMNIIRDEIDMLDTIYKSDIVHFEKLLKKELQHNILNEGVFILTRNH